MLGLPIWVYVSGSLLLIGIVLLFSLGLPIWVRLTGSILLIGIALLVTLVLPVWASISGVVLFVGVLSLFVVHRAIAPEEEEVKDEDITTPIRYNSRVRNMNLRDINREVIIGEDTVLGKLGSVRRVHALLHTNIGNELYIPETIRHLSKGESFKKGLCKDKELTYEEWEMVKRTYIKVSKDLQLKHRIKKSQDEIEENRKKLIKEQELKKHELSEQGKYVVGYIQENGESTITYSIKERVNTFRVGIKSIR